MPDQPPMNIFAPKLDHLETNKAAGSPSILLRQLPRPVERPFGGSALEPVFMLQRTIGNRATLRYLTQRLSDSPAATLGELSHVLERTGPLMHVPTLIYPGLLQRDDKAADAKKKEDPKVEAAKKKLKDKFGIKEFTQEEGVSWTESQLQKLTTAFSKMSPEEQKRLQGVTLHRTKQIAAPPDVKVPKGGKIVGEASSFDFMQFTAEGFEQSVVLHEAGHIIRASGLLEISKSKSFRDVEAAGKTIGRVIGPRAMIADMNAVENAGLTYLASTDDDRDANAQKLEDALDSSLAFQAGPEILSASNAKVLLEAYDRLQKWVDAVKLLANAQARGINEFKALVKTNKLDRKGFRPFTDYVALNWPAKPGEFFAECYSTWRNNRAYMQAHAGTLFDWFEKGRHLEGVPPSKPQP